MDRRKTCILAMKEESNGNSKESLYCRVQKRSAQAGGKQRETVSERLARELGISDNTLASGGRSNSRSMEKRHFQAVDIKHPKKKSCAG
jgi:hypothetical protein